MHHPLSSSQVIFLPLSLRRVLTQVPVLHWYHDYEKTFRKRHSKRKGQYRYGLVCDVKLIPRNGNTYDHPHIWNFWKTVQHRFFFIPKTWVNISGHHDTKNNQINFKLGKVIIFVLQCCEKRFPYIFVSNFFKR